MKLCLILITIFLLNSCGIYKPSDARKVSPNASERVKSNIEEGRGLRLSNLGKKQGGDFLFASSNPMWRAAIDKLSFAPFNVVDYSGGIIITDWYSDSSSDEQLKITIRFLSNEIRADGIDVIIHKKMCKSINSCEIKKINNNTNSEIRLAILKEASKLQLNDIELAKEKSGEYIPAKNP